MNLNEVMMEKEYVVKKIDTKDEELKTFLFSLGCFSGEPVMVISRRRKSLVIAVKNIRYNIDSELAKIITV